MKPNKRLMQKSNDCDFNQKQKQLPTHFLPQGNGYASTSLHSNQQLINYTSIKTLSPHDNHLPPLSISLTSNNNRKTQRGLKRKEPAEGVSKVKIISLITHPLVHSARTCLPLLR